MLALGDIVRSQVDGHDAWAAHLSKLIEESSEDFEADDDPETTFAKVKPYLDEKLRDEHADRVALADQTSVSADPASTTPGMEMGDSTSP